MTTRGQSGWETGEHDAGSGRAGDHEADGVDAYALSTARSRSGALAVVTTQQGLPVSVRIDSTALTKDPGVLAGEILRLCQQSAMAAGIRLREQLIAGGVGRDVVDSMKLPKADDLARAEQADDHDLDAPSSWLRSV